MGGVGILAMELGVMTDVTERDDKRTRSVECPKCRTRFAFRRIGRVRFDAQGFESYKFSCYSCRFLDWCY
jgi:hypothetical protein